MHIDSRPLREIVKEIRGGLTLVEFSQATGVELSALLKIEQGFRSSVGLNIASKLAKYSGRSLRDFWRA